MVAELALTMEESRHAMIIMPGDVMSVGDRSGQAGDVEGFRWSEDRAAPSEYARRRRLVNVDVNSGTFNLAVLRRPRRGSGSP